jgi:hypothetical protein
VHKKKHLSFTALRKALSAHFGQVRDVLDPLPSEALEGVFVELLHRLQRGKHLGDYQFLDGRYLIPIDGSQYFSSDKVHCPHCLVATGKGKKRYHHNILQASIVCPGMRQVLPPAPEQISNHDGSKQDCELNAARRLVKKIRKAHPTTEASPVTIQMFSRNRLPYPVISLPKIVRARIIR